MQVCKVLPDPKTELHFSRLLSTAPTILYRIAKSDTGSWVKNCLVTNLHACSLYLLCLRSDIHAATSFRLSHRYLLLHSPRFSRCLRWRSVNTTCLPTISPSTTRHGRQLGQQRPNSLHYLLSTRNLPDRHHHGSVFSRLGFICTDGRQEVESVSSPANLLVV